MGRGEDPLIGKQSASAESVGVGQVEQKSDVPGELILSGQVTAQNKSICPIRIAGDDPAEDGEVLQEGRSLPDGGHILPINGTNSVGYSCAKKGG